MILSETRMGGADETFPETTWGVIRGCGREPEDERKIHLNRLFQMYWRPVYAAVRRLWKKPIEEAKDLTQGFFCHILETDFLSKANSTEGRFRHFLCAALRKYLAHVYRGETTVKRGGRKTIISLDDLDLERVERTVERTDNPQEIFNDEWSSAVFDQCVHRLEKTLRAEGKGHVWEVYQAYQLKSAPDEGMTYPQIAEELDLTLAQVKNWLKLARARLHAILRECVRGAVSSPEEAQAEMRDLFPC